MSPGHFVYDDGDASRTPKCSDCGGTQFAEDRSEGCISCMRCGLVVEDHVMVDDGYHYKVDDNGFNANQFHGAPINPLLACSSMSTMIGYGGSCSRLMRNLQQQQSMPSKERSLYHKFKEISEALEMKLQISSDSVTKMAQSIWKDLKDKRVITKGEKNTAMLACCIYYACKLANFKRTRQNVLEAFDLWPKGSRKFKQASTILLENLKDRPYFQKMMEETINPDDYVVRMLSSLKVSGPPFWELVKEVRRMNALVEESEKMANLHTNTILATLVCVAAHSMGLRTSEGKPYTLDEISIMYSINTQTLKSKMKVLLTIEELSEVTEAALESYSKRKRRAAEQPHTSGIPHMVS